MRKCANISPYTRRPLVIQYMTLQLLHSELPYIWEKFDFLFYQCLLVLLTRVPASSSRNGSKATLSVEFFSLFELLDILPPNPSLLFLSTAAVAPFPPAFSAAARNQSVGDDPMSHESKFVSFQLSPPVSKSRRSGKASPSLKNAPLASEPVLLPLPPLPLACWAWQLWLASTATASASPFTLMLRPEAILCRHAPFAPRNPAR